MNSNLMLIAFVALLGSTMSLQIVSRSSWDARPPKSRNTISTPVPRVFVHHTATPLCRGLQACKAELKGIQNYHMDNKGWSDIGYSFLMDRDGVVYEGRGWTAQGAHTVNYNTVSIAISFIGDYTNTTATVEQKTALKQFIAFGIRNNYIKSDYLINGHRDVACTACPGNMLYDYFVKTLPRFDNSKKPKC